MKDIDFPEMEAGCMEIADLALYRIYSHAKSIYKDKDKNKSDSGLDILLSESDPNFYEDIESEEENENKVDDGTIRLVIKEKDSPTER